MTGESTFTADVARRARALGFKVWTVNQTRGKPRFKMDRGVPDIIMIGQGHVVFVETKVDKNDLSPEQREFRDAVTAVGGFYWVIRDMDTFMVNCDKMGWCKVII